MNGRRDPSGVQVGIDFLYRLTHQGKPYSLLKVSPTASTDAVLVANAYEEMRP